jgi:hypothetical protein
LLRRQLHEELVVKHGESLCGDKVGSRSVHRFGRMVF